MTDPDCSAVPATKPAPEAETVAALPRLLTLAEVARVFGRSTRTIRWWVASKRLRAVRVGRAILISEIEIRRMIDGQAHDP